MKKLQEYIFERYMDDDEYETYKKAGKPARPKRGLLTVEHFVDMLKDSKNVTTREQGGITYIDIDELAINDVTVIEHGKYHFPENIRLGNVTSGIMEFCALVQLFKEKSTFIFPQVLNIHTDDGMEFERNNVKHAPAFSAILYDGDRSYDEDDYSWDIPNTIVIPDNAVINGPLEITITELSANITIGNNVKFNDTLIINCYDSDVTVGSNVKFVDMPIVYAGTFNSNTVIDVPEMYLWIHDTEKLKLGSNVKKLKLDCWIEPEKIDLTALPKDASIEFGLGRQVEEGTLPKFPQNLSKGSITINSHPRLTKLVNLPTKCEKFVLNGASISTLDGCPKYVKYMSLYYIDTITSLEGGPKVADEIYLSHCGIENCNGAPEDIAEFACDDCKNFVSLEGLPLDTLEKINISNAGKTFSKSEINKYLD